MKTQTPAISIFLFLLTVYLGIAIHTALYMPADVTSLIYSEEGPYEIVSIWLWFLLGCTTLLVNALQTQTRLSAGVAALLMAARELGLPK